MTYIVAKDPTVRERLIRENRAYEESLIKPIDWDDPQVQANRAKFSAMTKPCGTPDTTDLDRLDAKIQPSFHSYLEDMWQEEMWEDRHGNLQPKPVHIQEEPKEEKERPMTRAEKFRHRPCLGCPDCRHWDVWKCECTNPAPKAEICDWISERYKEKGE